MFKKLAVVALIALSGCAVYPSHRPVVVYQEPIYQPAPVVVVPAPVIVVPARPCCYYYHRPNPPRYYYPHGHR